METSLKASFAQIFSRCPKILSCPKFGGAAAPLPSPARTPMACAICALWKILRVLIYSKLYEKNHVITY